MFVNSPFNGLWTVEFISTVNRFGKGVLVLLDGRLFGGDAGYYYSGRYEITGNTIQGNVNVTRFDANSISVFGDINQFALSFAGEINSTSISAVASLVSTPKFKMRMIGNKKEDF